MKQLLLALLLGLLGAACSIEPNPTPAAEAPIGFDVPPASVQDAAAGPGADVGQGTDASEPAEDAAADEDTGDIADDAEGDAGPPPDADDDDVPLTEPPGDLAD